MEYIEISNFRVGLSVLTIVVVILISFIFKLGIARSIFWASLRTIVQLLLLGFVLGWIFSAQTGATVIVCGLVMTFIAGYTASHRSSVRVNAVIPMSIASFFIAAWSVTGFALTFIVDVSPWFYPQLVIPLLGLILGNMLNGISLGLNHFLSSMYKERKEIETILALGASRWETARPYLSRSLKTGLIPMINAMSIVGIVSIPGMMTGQLLAGANPQSAVKYQIVIMFLISTATGLGTLLITVFLYFSLFSKAHFFHYSKLGTR